VAEGRRQEIVAQSRVRAPIAFLSPHHYFEKECQFLLCPLFPVVVVSCGVVRVVSVVRVVGVVGVV